MDNYKNLPVKWIKVDVRGNIIEEFCDRQIPQGHTYWFLAKAHFQEGPNGLEYYTNRLEYLAEALLVREDKEAANLEQVMGRWVYGIRIPLTSEAKSEELGEVETYEKVVL